MPSARARAVELASEARIQATGKRKSSIARVVLRAGSGSFEINKRSLEEYFPRHQHQTFVRQPLLTSGYEGKVDVRVRVHGGGIAGQAGAVRHGIARALTEIDADLRGELKRRGLLTRDARAKERRKAGLKKARKRPSSRSAERCKPALASSVAVAHLGSTTLASPASLRPALVRAQTSMTPRPSSSAPTASAGPDDLTASLRWRSAGAAALERRPAPGPDRPRHARVRADAGGGAGGGSGRGRGTTPGSAASCRRRPRRSSSASTVSTWQRSSRRPTTPGSTTGSSSSAPTGASWRTRARRASRHASPRRRRRARRRVGSASSTARSTTTGARCSRPSAWTSPGAACCSTAPTAPPTGLRRPSSSGWMRTSRRSARSRTGATSTRAAAPSIRSAGRAHRAARRGDRICLRRRRRPGDRGRRRGNGSRWRRADRALRPAPRRRRRTRRRRRRDGDEQLRLSPGDGRRRHRGRDDPGRRSQRDRRARAAGLAARRRAIRPHHLERVRADRRRDRRGAARDARAWTGQLAAAIPMQKLPQVLENVEVADRGRSTRRRRSGRRSSARATRSRAAAASWFALRAPSRSSA